MKEEAFNVRQKKRRKLTKMVSRWKLLLEEKRTAFSEPIDKKQKKI